MLDADVLQMTLPEGELSHKEYDPEAAHLYYLQNRKLKGRKKTASKPTSSRHSSGKSSGRGYVSKKAYMPTKSTTQLRSEADARVASIRVRLKKLTDHLDALMKKAVAEDDAKKSKAKDSKSSSSGSSNRTQKDKQSDHQYYEKNKAEIARKRKPDPKSDKKPTAKDTQAEIDKTKAMIVQVRAQLKAAIQRARQSTHPTKTAVKGR